MQISGPGGQKSQGVGRGNKASNHDNESYHGSSTYSRPGLFWHFPHAASFNPHNSPPE